MAPQSLPKAEFTKVIYTISETQKHIWKQNLPITHNQYHYFVMLTITQIVHI